MTTPFDHLSAALADRYRLERELGQGGMATVYLAHDLKHDRLVAVKVLRPELVAVLGGERFISEIRVTANLQHPNLLPLFDSGEAGGLFYYVMPFVEGETLRARLEREGQLGVDEAVRIVVLLAGALDHAHAHGVIHRDIKPENILLPAGQPVIADFGIALAVAQAGGARLTETGFSLGTPHYMSPEQAGGEREITARSDQYALAAVAYEMLAGEPPHTGPTAQAIIARLLTESPRSLRAARPTIPQTVDHAVARALAKAPADRFASCRAFAGALTGPPARRWPARPLALGVGTALVLTLAFLTTRLVSRYGQSPAGSADPTVAVMLFDNLTRDTAHAYLAHGLAAEIATTLARVPRLEVRSPGAVRTAQRATTDPGELGRRLRVHHVVEGDFQLTGDRIRVGARLVVLPEGTQRWADSWTRPVSDLLAVQEDIATAVARAIAGVLAPEDRSALAGRATEDPEAYDHFLRGNYLLATRTPDGVVRAIAEYRAALRRDSTFTRAEARIGLGYSLFLNWGWDYPGVPFDSLVDLGVRAVDRALALDSTSADAWMVRGILLFEGQPLTLQGAMPALRRATELDPRSAEAWHQYAARLMFTGRAEEAIAAFQRAVALDADRAVTWQNLGLAYELARRPDDALQAYARALAVDSEYYPTFASRTRIHLRRGELALARANAQAARRTSPPGEAQFGLAPMAMVAAAEGDTAGARRLVADALAPFARRTFGPLNALFVVPALIATGQQDAAMRWLERARPRGVILWWAMQFPVMDPIRDRPAFQRLLAASRPPGAW